MGAPISFANLTPLKTGYNLHEFHKSYFPVVRSHVEDDQAATVTVLACYKRAADVVCRPSQVVATLMSLAMIGGAVALWSTVIPEGHPIKRAVHVAGGALLCFFGVPAALNSLSVPLGLFPGSYDNQFLGPHENKVGYRIDPNALGDKRIYDVAGQLALSLLEPRQSRDAIKSPQPS